MREIIVDVSELEAPYPLVNTIEATKKLQEGEFIIMKHRMHPCKLFDYLEKNSFSYSEKIFKNGEVEVYIWYKDDNLVANYLKKKYV